MFRDAGISFAYRSTLICSHVHHVHYKLGARVFIIIPCATRWRVQRVAMPFPGGASSALATSTWLTLGCFAA
jgi:hypothetical protein